MNPTYISGRFINGHRNKQGTIRLASPSNHLDLIGDYEYCDDVIPEAIAAAQIAFKSWKRLKLEERKNYLIKFKEQVRLRESDLILALGREVGKPTWEAKTEVQSIISKIDITLNEGMDSVSDLVLNEIAPGVNGKCEYRPHGIMVVVGPFNFPGHLPNGHWVPALLLGNVVIFKPSEKAPLTARILTECMDQAGIPTGVFQCIYGEKEISRKLCIHPEVKGVLFTGSYEVGLRLKQDTLPQYWKILALEMGGKNSSLVWKDADIKSALYEVAFSAFATAGQRCTATSILYVHQEILNLFVNELVKIVESLKVGHYSEEVFMGPLIDESSVERYLKVIGIAEKEGATALLRGTKVKGNYQGNYVSPSIHQFDYVDSRFIERSYYLQNELFAPNLAVIPVKSSDDIIQMMNSTQYGLAASIFSKDHNLYKEMSYDLEFGIVNWNKSTAGASSRLPFGGLKKSGNHFPTALNAVRYCSYPCSSLEAEKPVIPEKLPPGFTF